MIGSLRLYLCLACLLLGAIEAPNAMHVLAEDLRGPYGPAAFVAEPVEPGALTAERPDRATSSFDESAEGDADAFDVDAALVARRDQR